MAYLVLARKHRPQSFEVIIGQESVATTLKNAIASKRISHAYLFFGPRGVGKTTAARILAKALNCKKGPTAEPCGQCPPCVEITQGSALDVLEMDAASNTSVENVREAIIDTVSLAPNRDRYKVFIIDEAHMLSSSAFNALLKTMEEPPGHVVFILATTEPHKIPATIFSRCQRFRFRPIAQATIAQHLKTVAKAEKIASEPEALELLARAASGSMRDGLSLMDQAIAFAGGKLDAKSVIELLGLLPQQLVSGILKAVVANDPKELWGVLQEVGKEGYEPVQILKDLRETLEAAYLDKLGVLASKDELVRSLAAARSAEGLAVLLKRLQRCLEEMRSTDSPRLTLELGLFGLLEAHDLGAWIERLEALEAKGGAAEEPEVRPAARAPQRPTTASAVTPIVSKAAVEPEEEPEAAPIAASTTPSPSVDSAWRAVLQLLSEENPAVFGYLNTARVDFQGGAVSVRFQTAFHRDGAQRGDVRLRELLKERTGRDVDVAYVVDAQAAAAVTDEAWEEERGQAAAALPAAGEWKDLGAADALAEDPGVKKVLQFFPGKVRRPTKKPE